MEEDIVESFARLRKELSLGEHTIQELKEEGRRYTVLGHHLSI
jgi:hypothetical protein